MFCRKTEASTMIAYKYVLTCATLLFLAACSQPDSNMTQNANPFFSESELYLQYPAYDLIEDAHFAPAFERGMEIQLEEIKAITSNTEPATFENTLVAMQRSGQMLSRVSRVFSGMTSAHTNETLESIRAEMAPKRAAHSDAIGLNPVLFERIKSVFDSRDSVAYDPESRRLIEETYKDFVRAGANLSADEKSSLMAFNTELASLQTSFSQNVLNEVNDKAIVVDSADELAGLTEGQIAKAAEAATARDMEGKFVIPLLNSSGQPVLGSLQNRALRERIYRTSISRGNSGGAYDNKENISRIARIRADRAKLLGFDNHAALGLSNQTAQTTQAVNELLATLAPPAVRNAKREAADLQRMIDSEGGNFDLAPWDWAFYTEKVRKDRFDFDASELKPYLEMNNVLENGVFYAAEMVFGITFKERTDLPVYQEDVRVWEVFDHDGSSLALFTGDFYARETKNGGAWMNAAVSQSGLMGSRPIIGNHQNIPKPLEGQPTLMTWSEVITMFHEFGHALHGMFSNVQYPRFSGTSVPRDFVEFPSQVNEMWASWPDVLEHYAVHYETGEPMPQALLNKIFDSAQFNQGFETTEYLAASLLDQAWHQRTSNELPTADEVLEFESEALAAAGVALDYISPRYRSTYFSHIIGGYSAGYYSYIWSEVLDADGVEWIKENGGMTRENGDRFRNELLSKGGSVDAMTLYRNFSGGDADIKHLLNRRGLN